MNIKIKLDLNQYSSDVIIDLVKDGIITTKEVRESGVVSTFFNDDLEKFLCQHEREKKCQKKSSTTP